MTINYVRTDGGGSSGSQQKQKLQWPHAVAKGLAESHGPACWAGIYASPADLLGPHMEQQIRGRQAKDHTIHREAAGVRHELHSLK